ncbi:hypothetical protein [Kibdelosporangium phytohabitans]|uniref:DUF3558 domain-containing protein n=1 Tax=Kibdelosporangium phytohabitans TaxID=860235 RepID=A0A0N7F388_9PSEU|nr:hypothetical protein [Kibdelosporangium phytohabitans]ALG07951.1 hypothetical protein AOZ06_14405 [Kibdelosporangium phytohabitans]MBE1471106.1 hypothetical protein [Kibdelosporangium phytohabitans]
MIRRFVCAAALSAFATALTATACTASITGTPMAAAPTVTDSAEPDVTTTPEEPYPTPPSDPTSTSHPSMPSSTRTSEPPPTIAKRKTITVAPACSTFVTPAAIGNVTGTNATAEPEDKGFCSYTLTRSGNPAGIALVVLTAGLETKGTTPTTFEGNTAHRLSTADTTCDLRIALTDDQSARYRVLWVSLVLTGHTEPVCAAVDKLAAQVFAKLPDS